MMHSRHPCRSTANAPMVEMRKVNKWYDKFQALKNVSLNVSKGERVVICGPSGSGKSTAIRCINRLEHHQEGQILVEGVELTAAVQEHRVGPRARSAWCSSSSTCSRI